MPLLDALIYGYRDISVNGIPLTRRSKINFVGVATDNPTQQRTDVELGDGSAAFLPQSIVWRPGVASAGGYVATCAEVLAFVSGTVQPAPVIVYCDTTLGNCIVPEGTDYDCSKQVYLFSAAPNLFAATVEFEDGAHLHRLAGARDIYFTGAPTSVVPLTFQDQSSTFERCQFYASSGTAVPFADIDGTVYITLNGGGAYFTEGTSFWDLLAGASCIFRHRGGSGGVDPAMQPIAFSGDVTTSLDFIHDANVSLPPQTAFNGTLTRYRTWVDAPLGTVATPDATPVFVELVALAAGEVKQVDAIATVAKADGSTRQSFRLSALVWNDSGTATLDGGSLTDGAPKGTGAAVVELVLSSASVYLKITGIADDLVTTYDASVL